MPSVFEAHAAAFARLGLFRLSDVLLHVPLRYENETRIERIHEAPFLQQPVQVEGMIQSCVHYPGRKGLQAVLKDSSGHVILRFLHVYPGLAKQLQVGTRIRAFGEIRTRFEGEAEIIHPRFKRVEPETPLPTCLTPVYHTTTGLSQLQIRKAVAEAWALHPPKDPLPDHIRATLKLLPFKEALRHLHTPAAGASLNALQDRSDPAWQRLKFDELLAQQLSLRKAFYQRRQSLAPIIKLKWIKTSLPKQLEAQLPFALTQAQKRVIKEIQQDLAHPHPMQRLLLGDVGTGKTLVAAMAALTAIEAGYQVALMAPTELLAAQHAEKFEVWLGLFGLKSVSLLGKQKKTEKRLALDALSSGNAHFAIGTHALFQEEVVFHRLGLIIVDEQHRFGVAQRLALRAKGQAPHQLMMTATPIPRTLAMSYCADLEVSVLDERPPGRTPIETKLISQKREEAVIERLGQAAREGRQAYWVCPLVEESEKLTLQAATERYECLKTALPDLNIGLVHGRLNAQEKQLQMQAFQAGTLHILVATTVIEVGVDVPNASLMIIEHPERMGLAQLHQLRGRVGRGSTQSACVLLYGHPLSDNAQTRLSTLQSTQDGFEIAQVDLALRGPGEFLGSRQSGAPLLRFSDPFKDSHLLELARNMAEVLLQTEPQAVSAYLNLWLEGREALLSV